VISPSYRKRKNSPILAGAVLLTLQTGLEYFDVQMTAKSQARANLGDLFDELRRESNTLDDPHPYASQKLCAKCVEVVPVGRASRISPLTAAAAKTVGD